MRRRTDAEGGFPHFFAALMRNKTRSVASIIQGLRLPWAYNRPCMGRLETITDADLLDYVEGRLSSRDRAIVAQRLATDPALARKCQRVREHTLNVRILRAVLPVESVPAEWLALLTEGSRTKGH